MEDNALPNHDVLGRRILCLADGNLALDTRRIERGRDPENNAIGVELAVEVGPEGDRVLDLGLADLINDRVQFKREVYVCRRAVPGDTRAPSVEGD